MFIPLKFVKCIKMKKREGKKIKEHNGYIYFDVSHIREAHFKIL